MHKWPPGKGGFRGTGDKRETNTILSCMKLYFLWASNCSKCQPTAKVEKRIKIKTNKKKKIIIQVILLVLQSPLCASGWEGQSLSVQQSAPSPLFLDYNALEKALISWVQYFKIETQTSFSMNIQKKRKKKSIKYFKVNKIGWTHWEGVCLPVRYRTPPDQ